MLQDDCLGQLLESLLHGVLHSEKVAAPREWSGFAPILERIFGSLHCSVNFIRRGEGHACDDFIRGRIVDIEPAARFGIRPFAIDIVLKGLDSHC